MGTLKKPPTRKKLPSSKVKGTENAGPVETNSFPIVGIGASAGGFEASMELLHLLPADTGMAFAFFQHLDPKYPSKLRDLMSNATKMPVVEITNGLYIRPDHVYILPPNHNVALSGRSFELVKYARSERVHKPIDYFFQSLAQAERNCAIGVILSGTGSDGTAGLSAIKAAGGLTFAQAEISAKYFGMPRSAIISGCVDAVLTLPQLAKELARISKHPFLKGPPIEKALLASSADFPEHGDAYSKIFFLLKQHSGVDFSRYKHSTLQRRITRRLVLHRLEHLDQYVKFLRNNVSEMDELFYDLLINVTGFFRDKQAFAMLKKKVFPKLIKQKIQHGGEIRIWIPGCATGEEAYSIAICLVEQLEKAHANVRVQIFGTDLSEIAINKARAGIYPETITKDVSAARLRRFFTKVNGSYQISRSIRDMCTFARQNICEDPPFSRLDIVSCRNVLIYLGPSLQKKALPIFHYALNSEGFLMLGTSETIGVFADLFTLVDKRYKIYQKKISPFRHELDFGKQRMTALKPDIPRAAIQSDASIGTDIQKLADRIILNNYAPGGVVIDKNMQVLEFRGHTAPFIEHAPGAASLNILHMVRSSLMVDLRTAIHKALKQKQPVQKESRMVRVHGESQEVNIDVIPFRPFPSSEPFLLVLFRSTPAEKDLPEGGKPRRADKRIPPGEVERLRTELSSTKESLQAIIEEQEATNEELKSANEEIESANEELQSTNEELETAKEELQSTNEELTTLNEELINRNGELAQLNDDLNNLLTSINIPIIMVDANLTVRRVTPQAQTIFNLIPADVGRKLTDIKPNIHLPNMDKMIREVIDDLMPHEIEVRDRTGTFFSLRIRPYRTKDNKIDGAVITLVDLGTSKPPAGRTGLGVFTEIIRAEGGQILLLDSHSRIQAASNQFYTASGLTAGDVEYHSLHEISRRRWSMPKLRKALETLLAKKQAFTNLEVIPQDGKKEKAWVSAKPLQADDGHFVVLTIKYTRVPQ